MYAMMHEDEIAKYVPARKRKKKWTGWKLKTDEQKIEFQREVMRSRDEKLEENLKAIGDAAGKLAHSTENEKGKLQNKHRRMREHAKKPPPGAQK